MSRKKPNNDDVELDVDVVVNAQRPDAIAPAAPANDIMAYTPEDVRGNFAVAAHVAALAEEAAKHLPRWMGSHPRIEGCNASAEVTKYGTLLVTNEITMQDFPAFVQWCVQNADLPVAAVLPCGHPASALVKIDPRKHGVGGVLAEENTNTPSHCGICAQLEQAQRAVATGASLREKLETAQAELDRGAAVLENLREDLAREREERTALENELEDLRELAAKVPQLEKELKKRKARHVDGRALKAAGAKPRGKARKK